VKPKNSLLKMELAQGRSWLPSLEMQKFYIESNLL